MIYEEVHASQIAHNLLHDNLHDFEIYSMIVSCISIHLSKNSALYLDTQRCNFYGLVRLI